MKDAIEVEPQRLGLRILLSLLLLALCAALFAPRQPCDNGLLLLTFSSALLFDSWRTTRLLIHADAPLLAIAEEGVRLNPVVLRARLVPWADLDSVRLVQHARAPHHPQVVIRLRNPGVLPPWRRILPFGWNRRLVIPSGIAGRLTPEMRALAKRATELGKTARRAVRRTTKRAPRAT